MSIEAPRIYLSDALAAVASWRGVSISWFAGQPTIHHLRAFRSASRDLIKRSGALPGLLVLDHDPAGKVDLSEQMRKEVKETLYSFNDHNVFGAVVIDADGIAGATIRALVSGVLLLARTKYPIKIFNGHAVAADWLAAQMKITREAPTAAEIIEALALVKSAAK